MPQEIRLWEVSSDDSLREIGLDHLDLESRIERWLEEDISVVGDDLLVIGRQVQTDFGGALDLLCMDPTGDLVIVELKRDKTPREITAQVLDYASWVDELSNDRVRQIADAQLGDRGPLEHAFRTAFGSELPGTLNNEHSMLIVAARLDASSERIVRYLSDSYGVSINVLTFQYFRTPDGREIVGQVFLLEPEEVEYRATTRGGSKRRRRLSYEELEALADDRGIGDLYRLLVERLRPLVENTNTTQSNIQFRARWSPDQGPATLFNVLPGQENPLGGVPFQAYATRISQWFRIPDDTVRRILPANAAGWEYQRDAGPDWSGFAGEFTSTEEIHRFAAALEQDGDQGTESTHEGDLPIGALWVSDDEREWTQALARYMRFVKPSDTELVEELEPLDLAALRPLDAQGWYEWLHDKYFRWKYTAPNRLATTRKSLSWYDENEELDELLEIRDRLLSLNTDDIAEGLRIASSVRGLGIAGASGLLALIYPAKFATVDQFVVKALREVADLPEAELIEQMNPEGLREKDGVVLIQVMRRKALENNRLFGTDMWTPKKIDEILWTYGR